MKKRIGLGTWSWGNKVFWDYKIDNDENLRETYEEALKRGFYLIDTADSYGTGKLNGRSEELLGKFLLETPTLKKKRIQIATKLAPYPWRVGNKGFTKPFLKSLERLNNKLDIIATDHAPHTKEEKNNLYFSCPSGAPMVQHALPMMLQHTLNNKISIERVVEKMSHAPAICFKLKNRGFIREGYHADLVIVQPNTKWSIKKENIL